MLLYIIVGILLLIFAFLFLNLKININYNDDIKIRIGILFFMFNPLKEKKKTDVTKKKKEKSEIKSVKEIKTKIKREGIVNTFNEMSGIIKEVMKKFVLLLKHVKIKRLDLKIAVADSDAAVTAISFGKFCAVFYPFMAFLNLKLNIKKQETKIFADYSAEETKIYANIKIRLKIIYMIIFAMGSIKQYIKYKKLKEG